MGASLPREAEIRYQNLRRTAIVDPDLTQSALGIREMMWRSALKFPASGRIP